MKPWAKYTFDGINWIPDREADIITAMKEAKEKMYKEFIKFVENELWAPVEFEQIDKEKTMNITIAPTNVISFDYSTANQDNNPLVFVTDVSEHHVGGYNLHYHQKEGLVYRKYLRCNMLNVINITSEALTPTKPKPFTIKDLKVGDRFSFYATPTAEFVLAAKEEKTCSIVLVIKGDHWAAVGTCWPNHLLFSEVIKRGPSLL